MKTMKTMKTAETQAQRVDGLHYRSKQARKILDQGGVAWDGLWPVVDGDGRLTGDVIDSQDGYYNVDDLVMVAAGDLEAEQLNRIRAEEEDGTFDGYVTIKNMR